MTTKQNAPNTEDRPLITKINMAGTIFDISTTKDWSENDASRKGYIENRTHYTEEITTTADDTLVLETSHEFLNTYTKAGVLLTSDTWQVSAPWFILNKQFKYNLSFKVEDKEVYNADGPVETQHIELDPNNKGYYLAFDADTCTFSLAGEEFADRTDDNTDYPRSKSNTLTLTLRACENQSYNLIHQLGAEYIPIDNDTIRRTKDGKLFVDDTFSEDFYATAPFGKYGANSWVSAKGKSAKEVIFEAFCEDLQPTIVLDPYVLFEITPEVANGTYELGTSAKLDWKVSFNPGKYSYGTTRKQTPKNDSNMYVANIKLYYMNNDASSIIDDATYKLKNSETVEEKELKLGDHDYSKKELTIFCPQNPNGGTYVIAEGKAFVPITDPGLQGSATLEVKCVIDSVDPAATIGGNKSNPVKVFETNWAIDAAGKEAEKQRPDFVISEKGKVYGAYRWFWGYFTADDLKKNPTLMKSEDFRGFISNGSCLLEKFPEQIRTTKMQQLFFAAPAGTIKSGTFKVFNSRTGASAGKIYKYDEPLQITDASESTTRAYDVFYISNAKADSGTNTYTIEYEIGGTD